MFVFFDFTKLKMNFSQLKNLLSVIEKDQPRFFNQFDTILTSEKYAHLKQGLVEYEAEDELVLQLYGELNTGAYSKLKGRFTEQLLDVFLLSKSSNLKSYSGTVLSKYWQLTLIFKSMGQFDISRIFALKGLRIAERKKKFKQAFKFADYLKSYHMLSKWDLSAYKDMECKARAYRTLFNEEQHLKDIYFSLSFQLSTQRLEELNSSCLNEESIRIIQEPNLKGKHAVFYYHSSIVLKGILEKNYMVALEYIDYVYADFKNLKSRSWVRLLENLTVLRVQIYAHLKDFDKAWTSAKDLESSGGNIELGRIALLKIRILLRLKRYQEAFDLFITFFPKLKRIRSLELPFIEGFDLVHGLFYALYKLGKLKSNASFFKSFRYFKWLNSLPIYTKDKMGMNISVLIVDFLIGKTESWSSMYSKAEQLDLYRYRYLKKESSYTPICQLFKIFKEYAKHKMDKDVIELLKVSAKQISVLDPIDLPLYFSEIELLSWKGFACLALEEK